VLRWENHVSSVNYKELAKIGRHFAFIQILVMLMTIVLLALVTHYFWNTAYTKSSLMGGAVIFIPNVFFALKAFRYAGARSLKKVMASFFSGARIKLVLTAILFTLAFKLFVIEPVPFLISFCSILALPLLTPFFIKH
jgi:ATP synthase protein I